MCRGDKASERGGGGAKVSNVSVMYNVFVLLCLLMCYFRVYEAGCDHSPIRVEVEVPYRRGNYLETGLPIAKRTRYKN